jgi:hypothetical protein
MRAMHAGFLERNLEVEVTEMHTKADMVKAVAPAAKPVPAASVKTEAELKSADGAKAPATQALKITKPAPMKVGEHCFASLTPNFMYCC